MADLFIIETGNGGDLKQSGNDLAVVQGYENFPYLAMFSGDDWWGNDLLLTGDASTQFLSKTEKVLGEVALNSAGRIKIEQAVNEDLAFLKSKVPGTNITVSATIISDDRLDLNINIDGQQFYYQWSPADGFLTYKV